MIAAHSSMTRPLYRVCHELICDTKRAGNSLYVLSNMQFSSIEHLEASHDIWRLFDGAVVSCRIRRVKPERAIYEHLLREHRLHAADTVFIDDMPENLSAAAQLGIRTIGFVDAAQARQALMELGCLA